MATGCNSNNTNSNSSNSSSSSNNNTYRLIKQQNNQQISRNPSEILKQSVTIETTASTNLNYQQQTNNLYNDTETNEINLTNLNDSNCHLNSNSNNLKSNGISNNNSNLNSNLNDNLHQALQIKTKSIENTLLPLVNQIATLVNFKDNLKNLSTQSATSTPSINSEKTANALLRVGEAVNLAVERFVSVGEAIAYENPTIKLDMLDACREARNSGYTIKLQTQITNSVVNIIGVITNNSVYTNTDKVSMIQAANNLLNSVTKVLLLADVVIINQILSSKNKVLQTLNKLENVIDFWNFVRLFTQYGTDLIELAHLSGERQNDLKDDKRRSQLSSARWILEKSTVMILSSSKAYLKHLECECAKENVCLVYSFLYQALDTLHYVIVDSGSIFDFSSPIYNNSMFKSSIVQISFINAYRQFEDALDLARNNMLMENDNILVLNALSSLIDSTQDFTDSLYVNNDQRERIIRLQNEIREKTLNYLREEHRFKQHEILADGSTSNNNNQNTKTINDNANENQAVNMARFTRLFKTSPILNDCDVLKRLLQSQTMQLANSLFRENQDATLLNSIKTYALSNQYDMLIDTLDKFKEYSEHVLELCKLLRHISTVDVFEVTCEHHFNVFENLSKMIQSSAGTAALHSTCKSANENLNLYCESWENQVNDLSVLVKEMQESGNGIKSNKTVYLSLPRPGRHGTSARISAAATKPSKLDSNEQAKIAKLGLEMKLITSEIEAEADRWNEPQNELVKLAKLMSDMAYEIHLFTRGEGPLKTTQDLFSRAEIFLQHSVLLYNIVREFLNQVPNGFMKDELMQLIEKLPINFKQLKNRLKQVTIGKTATFNKVDYVIQETRDFMNLIAKLVTSCFMCSTKYNINYEQTINQINQNNFNSDFLNQYYKIYQLQNNPNIINNEINNSNCINKNNCNNVYYSNCSSVNQLDNYLLVEDQNSIEFGNQNGSPLSSFNLKNYSVSNNLQPNYINIHNRFSTINPSCTRPDSRGATFRSQSLHRKLNNPSPSK